MKKISVISFVALMVLSLCSCSNTDYQKVIPANSPLVVKVDVRSLADKSEFDKSEAMQTMENALTAMVSDKDMDQVKKLMKDPMEMGFDLSMPVYAFMADMETFGLTMKVNDEEAVKEFLLLLNRQSMSSKPVEKDGLVCGTLLDDFTYAYDGQSFLLLGSSKGAGKADDLAHQLMNQDEKQSFVSSEGYERLEDVEKDVVMYMDFASLPEKAMKDYAEILPKSLKYKDLEAVASLMFEKGEAQLSAKVFGKTQAAKDIIKETNDHLDEIDGEYLDKVSDEAVLWLGAGVKGEWLLSKIKESKALNELLFVLEQAIDVEQMIRSIDGDVSLEIPTLDAERGGMEFVAYAELDDSKFLADVEDWKKSQKDFGIEMKEQGKNQYILTMNGETFNWGVDDDDLYMGTTRAFNHSKESTGALLKPYKKQIKESQMFLLVNIAAMGLDNQISDRSKGADWVKKNLKGINAIILKSASADEATLVIEMKNKDENFLKQIL